MKTKQHIQNERGFTLVELLVVIVILGVLAGIIGPRLIGETDKAKVQATRTQIDLLGNALDQFRLDTGRYPTTQEGLQALVTNPGIDEWDGRYLKKNKVPTDGWKNPFNYQSPGANGEYDLYSYGADGTSGGDGYNADINSWE